MQQETQRIAKFIASAGHCSRRDAEKLILDKKVKMNGQLVIHPATFVSAKDVVVIDGKKLRASENIRVWVYNKPKGLITSHKDTKGRQTVFEALPQGMPRVISVGRLDYNTEGLLLLTNSGSFARKLELPSSNLLRKYRCRIFGSISNEQIAALKSGIKIGEISYKSIIAVPRNNKIHSSGKKFIPGRNRVYKQKQDGVSTAKHTSSNSWVDLFLSEGKNREIRNIFEHFGLEVSRLVRTDYGPFCLGDLKSGCLREATTAEMNKITELLDLSF